MYSIAGKATVPSAAFLAVATSLSPSFNSNSYLSASRVLPFRTFLAVIEVVADLTEYEFTKTLLSYLTLANFSP